MQDLSADKGQTLVFRRWLWFATACLGWSMVLLLFVTIKWTPDCGGIAYGLPLPFIESSLASSMEFNFFMGPFVLDILTYMLVTSVPVWLFVRHAHKQSSRRRRLYAVALALLVILPCVEILTFARIEVWPRGPLFVNEWRAREAHIGLPRWGSHLENQCN